MAAGDWDAPTPCAEWDVRALVNHVVNELSWVVPLFDGRTVAEVGGRFDGDLLGDDPAAAYRAAAEGALASIGRPGAAEQIVHLSFGDVPGADYLGQITSDVTIHSWDLARASKQDERLDHDLVAAVYAFLSPRADGWRGAGVFGPPVDPGNDAGPQERLLALSGRAS